MKKIILLSSLVLAGSLSFGVMNLNHSGSKADTTKAAVGDIPTTLATLADGYYNIRCGTKYLQANSTSKPNAVENVAQATRVHLVKDSVTSKYLISDEKDEKYLQWDTSTTSCFKAYDETKANKIKWTISEHSVENTKGFSVRVDDTTVDKYRYLSLKESETPSKQTDFRTYQQEAVPTKVESILTFIEVAKPVITTFESFSISFGEKSAVKQDHISVKQSLKLSIEPNKGAKLEGNFTYSVPQQDYVSVSADGIVTGLKETPTNTTVKLTVTNDALTGVNATQTIDLKVLNSTIKWLTTEGNAIKGHYYGTSGVGLTKTNYNNMPIADGCDVITIFNAAGDIKDVNKYLDHELYVSGIYDLFSGIHELKVAKMDQVTIGAVASIARIQRPDLNGDEQFISPQYNGLYVRATIDVETPVKFKEKKPSKNGTIYYEDANITVPLTKSASSTNVNVFISTYYLGSTTDQKYDYTFWSTISNQTIVVIGQLVSKSDGMRINVERAETFSTPNLEDLMSALKMDTIEHKPNDTTDTTACTEYWPAVKTAYEKLNEFELNLFNGQQKFANAKARYNAWAARNPAGGNGSNALLANYDSTIIIVSVSVLTVALLGAAVLLLKRRKVSE